MLAVEYKLLGPYKLVLEEVSIEWPPKKSPSILCKTKFSGISPGTEVAAWSGQRKLRPSGGYPRKIGYQNISEIIAISGKTQGIRVGDLVYTNQGHNSAFNCEPAEIIAVLPRDHDPKKYLFAYMYHMGLCALSTKMEFQEKEHNISIFGGGALGMTVAELSQQIGFSSVVVTDVDENSQFKKQSCTRINRENFSKEYLHSNKKFQQCIITTNSWDDYNVGLSTLGIQGTMTLLGFLGRDGTLPTENPFSPELFYVNNLSIFSTPNLRKDLFNSRSETISMEDSISDIVHRIENGELGYTFDNIEVFDHLKLASIYSNLETRKTNALTAGIVWSEA